MSTLRGSLRSELSADAARSLRATLLAACPQARIAIHLAVDAETPLTYVYATPGTGDAQGLSAMQAVAETHYPQAERRVLLPLMAVPGQAQSQASRWHYVVETDVLAGAESDFNAWYEQEHLPGLAAVPGTVLARRWRCDEGAPRYHAAYELVSRATFGSPAWLAVRATDWSSRVRPSFCNTRRIMFRTLED